MADHTEEKHNKQRAEKLKGEKALQIAKELEKEQISNGAKSVVGPIRSIILKKKK